MILSDASILSICSFKHSKRWRQN